MMSTVTQTLSDQDEFERGCAGKEKFPSESAAKAAIDAYHKAGMLHHKSALMPYRCRFCEQYHYGH